MSIVNILSKLTITILIIIVVITGFNWLRTPHLSPEISLKCETPDTPEQLAKLVIVRGMYDDREAYYFAKRFARFSWYSGLFLDGFRHELYSGLYNITFYGVGMSHFEFNMPFKERYKTEILSEAQCIEKADRLISEIKEYFNSSLEYREKRIKKKFPSYEFGTVVSANTPYYYRIDYEIYYDGVELLGEGTDAWVEVCDKEILGYQLHFPVLEERGFDKVYLTPIEALNRLDAGSIVNNMNFGYYTDFVFPKNFSDNIPFN